jgi:N-formylglutamate amidohydrolase
MAMLYAPYHGALQRVLERKCARFGFVILICGHSMPSQGRRGHADPGSLRADLVPGSRGRTSAHGAIIDLVDRHGRARGWSVRHDDPYRGGFSTGHYGRPDRGMHAVQLEIARRLYMDEATLRIDAAGLAGAREFARTLVGRLALADREAALSAPRRDATSH